MADIGHIMTDQEIKRIEDQLYELYTQAAEEIREKADDYLRRFKIKDKKWQQWVKDGKKTQEEYDRWRMGQIAAGKRWEKLKDAIAEDLMHTNEMARQIIAGEMPEIFGLNANYALYQVEHDGLIDTSLTLYNREAVDRILRDDPELLLPPGRRVAQEIAEGRAVRWERNQIQSVMIEGILQGESIPHLATRLAEKVADKDFKAAVRNARTMSTNAQNAGRYDAYRRVRDAGVDVTLEWTATLDNRTRHAHRLMHGQRRKVDEPFEVDNVKILYPAQCHSEYKIPQEMIWNCRCTILSWVTGFEMETIKTSDKMGGMTFEEWLKAKEKPEPILRQKEKGDAIRAAYINEYRRR